jgi:hypothetical protein
MNKISIYVQRLSTITISLNLPLENCLLQINYIKNKMHAHLDLEVKLWISLQ